jgi:hypothetical protein
MTSSEAFHHWLWHASLIVGMVCLGVGAIVAIPLLVIMLRRGKL